MSGLSDGVYTELCRAVHRVLFAIRNNRVSAFHGEVYTGRIGPIVRTLESVRIIEVSARRGSTVIHIHDRVLHLYISNYVLPTIYYTRVVHVNPSTYIYVHAPHDCDYQSTHYA